jgi:stress-induced-phosphoprotein 1
MQFRDMGNSAFSDKRYKDAIVYYTQAINLGDKEYACYSNRSAAHLRSGNIVQALEDATNCIAIKPSYHKGHIRRVAVFHQMQQYEDAIAAYKEGLAYCPDDKTLLRGLKEAEKKVRQYLNSDDEQPVLPRLKF